MPNQLLKSFLAEPYDFLVGTFYNLVLYLRALKINVLIFLFVLFIFTGPSQSIDLFNGLAMDGVGPNLIFWCSLTLLCLMMWYTSIHFLIRYDLTAVKDENDFQQNVVPLLPFLAGISIYLIALYGFSRDEVVPNNLGWFYLIGGSITIYGVMKLRDSVTKNLNLSKGEDILKVLREPVDDRVKWTFLSGLDKFIIITGTVIYFLALFIVLILSFAEVKPVTIPLFFQASTIICLYFSGLLMLLLFLWSALGYRLFKVVILAYIIIGAIFSNYNNNHAPRLLNTTNSEQGAAFTNWLNAKFDLNEYDEQNKLPVYLVAAEGGGIRSMKWTALVLDKLYGSEKQFGDHLYALSGVSGGSVGIVFQQAALPFCPGGCPKKLDAAVSEDFLSPVTLGLLGPDLFAQSFIPAPINEWDRSKWLEDSWSYSFQQVFNQAALDEGINDYWTANKLPNMYLNCTALETGQKAIISNASLSSEYFGNVIDLQQEINEGQSIATFPLKTAASMSARFPLVTSAAKTTTKNGVYNIVDGGYHDNTGLETISQLLNEAIVSTDTSILNKCRFSILYIKNGAGKEDTISVSQDFLVDLNAPVSVFLNNWNDRTISMVKNMESTLETYRKLGIDSELYTIELDRKDQEINLPLGWYLSETSSKEITRQAVLLDDENATEFDSEVAKTNHEQFNKLLAPLR